MTSRRLRLALCGAGVAVLSGGLAGLATVTPAAAAAGPSPEPPGAAAGPLPARPSAGPPTGPLPAPPGATAGPLPAPPQPGGQGATSGGRTLAPDTRFLVPPPPLGAIQQEAELVAAHHMTEAAGIAKMLATPQAVWFDGTTPQGTTQSPQQATLEARAVMAAAAVEQAVPVIVIYDIPGRDCNQYSAGGALTSAQYEQYVGAVAAGIGGGKAVVILEPDALGNLPSDCLVNDKALNATNYPFTDQERISELDRAVQTLEADPGARVYLDGTHSAWQNVGRIAQRLVEAGVQQAQGFFLNVSNYQYTANNIAYGTWISDCIGFAELGGAIDASKSEVVAGTYVSEVSAFSACPDQYWNGGPPGTVIARLEGAAYSGVALSPYGVWSATSSAPDLNISGEDARYASDLGSTAATTHFVIDTSRNGNGPNPMAGYAAAPYDQPANVVSTLASGSWCNPPGAGLGLEPTADTGLPLVDAFLWVKIPGESDGQCDSAGGVRGWDYADYSQPGWPTTATAQSLFDPLWGVDDPPAGAWFPEEAIQLTKDANQSTSSPANA